MYMDTDAEMQKKVSAKQKELHEKRLKTICLVSSLTSDEIMNQHIPATETSQWYSENCIGNNVIPRLSVNGKPRGTPFYTANGKIMKSEPSVQQSLKLDFKK